MATERPDTFPDIIDEMIKKDPGLAAWLDPLSAATQTNNSIVAYQPRQSMPAPADSPVSPPAAIFDVLREALEYRESQRSTPADISDKQMRALGRNHLIMMLRDTQTELNQLREEYEALLSGLYAGLALQAGGYQ